MKVRIAALVFASFCAFSQAQTVVKIEGGNQAVIADDGLGVELKFDDNGKLFSIKSTFFHPVDFPDRRGINKAYIIAEEKAKANIARYMPWSKENTRKVIESLEEVTGSNAQAVLQGVRILERSYDEKSEEAKVVVGINRQSRAGAAQLEQSMNSSNSGSKSNSTSGEAQAFPAQPSERRRAADADKF